jgi:outer membrane protein
MAAILTLALCDKMISTKALGCGAMVVFATTALASSGWTETLSDAVLLAYRTNPTLQSQRAQLRAIDEDYASALSQLGPTVQVQITSAYQKTQLGKSTRIAERISTKQLPDYLEQNSAQGEIVITQPLYTGGRVSAEIDTAAAKVRAGREGLKASEANILLGVILAYADVRKDLQSLDVRGLNLETLEHQLLETRARWRAGEVTQTDVSQAEAQLASEQALFSQAQGQLMVDRAAYFAVVGQNPGDLAPEPEFDALPRSVEEAFEVAEETNPELKQAYFIETESRSKVAATRAAYRGNVSVTAQYGYSGTASPYDPRNLQRAAVGQITFTKPLYTSGLDRAQIGQAMELNNSDRFNIESVRRSVVQGVANAWNQMVTSERSITAQEAQVKAAAIAFKGMRLEYRAGDRSTLDVLISEETLRDAELQLIAARRDRLIAQASLLRQMGRLDLGMLVSGAQPYQPAIHFRDVLAETPAWGKYMKVVDGLGQKRSRVIKTLNVAPVTYPQSPSTAHLAQNLPEIVSSAPSKAD